MDNSRWLSQLKKLREYLVYSNIWVALSAASLTYVYYQSKAELQLTYTFLSFCLTFLGYNFIYLISFIGKDEAFPDERQQWVNQNRLATITLCASAIVITFFIIKELVFAQLITIVIASLLTTFYTMPLRRKGLRNIPGLKILVISATWTLITAVLPHLDGGFSIELVLSAFCLVAGLSIPFDIAGLIEDDSSLKSIPQIMGTKTSIVVAAILLTSGFLLHFKVFESAPSIFVCATALIAISVVKKTNRQYIEVVIEGIPVLWAIAVFVWR